MLKTQTTHYLIGANAPTLEDIETQYIANGDMYNLNQITEYTNIDNKYCQTGDELYQIQPIKTITTPYLITQIDHLIKVDDCCLQQSPQYTMTIQKITVNIIPELQMKFVIEIEKYTRQVISYYYESI